MPASRPVAPAHGELLLARRAGDDARTERLANFDRGKPDAARRTQDEQRSPGLSAPRSRSAWSEVP
jgi:hypothetical protein